MFEVLVEEAGPIEHLVVTAEDYNAEMAEIAEPALKDLLTPQDLAETLKIISGAPGKIEIDHKAVAALSEANLLTKASALSNRTIKTQGGWRDIRTVENGSETRIEEYVLSLPGDITSCEALSPIRLRARFQISYQYINQDTFFSKWLLQRVKYQAPTRYK